MIYNSKMVEGSGAINIEDAHPCSGTVIHSLGYVDVPLEGCQAFDMGNDGP